MDETAASWPMRKCEPPMGIKCGRRIVVRNPEDGTIYVLLTNDMTLPPGVVSHFTQQISSRDFLPRLRVIMSHYL